MKNLVSFILLLIGLSMFFPSCEQENLNDSPPCEVCVPHIIKNTYFTWNVVEGDTEDTTTTEYLYEAGKLIERNILDEEGNIEYKRDYFYTGDRLDSITFRRYTVTDIGARHGRIDFLYDDQDRIVKRTAYYSDDESPIFDDIVITDLSYSDNVLIVERENVRSEYTQSPETGNFETVDIFRTSWGDVVDHNEYEFDDKHNPFKNVPYAAFINTTIYAFNRNRASPNNVISGTRSWLPQDTIVGSGEYELIYNQSDYPVSILVVESLHTEIEYVELE